MSLYDLAPSEAFPMKGIIIIRLNCTVELSFGRACIGVNISSRFSLICRLVIKSFPGGNHSSNPEQYARHV